MSKFFLAFAVFLCSLNSFAGTIKGTVVDDKNGSPLVGVFIAYKGAADTGFKNCAVTDIDGKYEITLKEGDYTLSYTYFSYTAEASKVSIEKGKELTLNIRMKGAVAELKGATISARRITNTEAAVINEIKASNSVVSGTSSSQISKSMDRNAADVVKRIPGVSIQDDRFVVIRGLPDRYNTVWLNDAGAPSSEADKKSFSFDIIPSGLIDRVLVFKTPSPELPGDFAGGMVKVYTTTLQDKNQLMVSMQTSSREYTTGRSFSYNEPTKTDWLGYDDGSRSIPAGTPDRINKSSATQDHVAITKAFKNDWIIKNGTAAPDKRFAMSYTGGLKWKKIKIGNTLGLTYTNTKTNYATNRQDWDDSIARNYNYLDQTYTDNVSVGILENAGIAIGNTKIEFKNLYSQIGKSTLIIRDAVMDGTQTPMRAYSMGYDSKATYAAQLTGNHKSKDDGRKYNWTFGYNDVFKNTPDLRRIKYTKSDVGMDTIFKTPISASVDPNNGGGRYYATLYEKIYSFNHQFSQKINLTKNYSFTVNAGNYIEMKSRAYNIRKLGYTINPTGGNGAHADSLKKLPVNEIFADTNVGTKKNFVMDELTDTYDKYSAKNKHIASFVSINAPVGKHITIVGGARYEYNEQSLTGYISTDTFKPVVTTKYLLPSINVAYNFTDKSLLRAAYGKTLNRPEFREFATTSYYDFEELATTKGALYPSNINKGGDTLKVAEIQNIDFRYEFYPSQGEMIHLGMFYKSIANPIQRVIDPGNSPDNKVLTYINGTSAYCMGIELDLRKNLVFIDNKLGTKFFKDITFISNFAVSKSQSKIDTTLKHQETPAVTLQGQSPYIINLGAYYQNDKLGIRGSLLYNTFGARLYAVGTINNSEQSIGELPFQSFDFTATKTFKRHYLLNVGIQNMLGSKVSFVKDMNRDGKFTSKAEDRQYKSYNLGRYYTVGIKVNF